MSLDPNHLTNSNGLKKASDKAVTLAKQAAIRKARKQALNFVRKKVASTAAKKVGKHIAAKGAKVFASVVYKLLSKAISILVAALGTTFGFVGIMVLVITILLIILAFVAYDFNFDGKSDLETIYPVFEEISLSTIDSEKPEQIEWKVPTGLIASFVHISQIRNNSSSPSFDDSVVPIPTQFIQTYKDAEAEYGTPWYLLAAIHRVETTFSTDPNMVSSVGAIGPFQFMGGTWAGWKYVIDDVGNVDPSIDITNLQVIKEGKGYGVDADGDGKADPWNFYDACFSAAKYLAANGAASNMRIAVYRYNHSQKYVDRVVKLAEYYRDGDFPISNPGDYANPVKPPDSYEALADEFVKGIEPEFQYSTILTNIWQYTVREQTDSEGNTSTSKTEPKVIGQNAYDMIDRVDTFRGTYTLEYEKFPTEYQLVDTRYDGKSIIYIYQMEEKIEEVNRFYSPNYNSLLTKARSLGFANQDIQLALHLFNTQVDANSPEATNRLPIKVDGITSDNSGFDLGEGEDLPPDLLLQEYIWPVPTIKRISSGYGYRPGGLHKGIDISNGNSGNTPIYAIADGTVIHAGPRDPNGFGQAIYIDHGNGVYSRYGHLQWNGYGVKTGQKVKKGQFIGRIGEGKVGSSTGPHLHFEIIINGQHTSSGNIVGTWINPLQLVRP